MAAKAKSDTAENFIGSVFKFSISTFINFGISGLALLLTSFLLPDKDVSGEINQFLQITNTIMTIVIFGLDQSFIRFFNEPPGRLDAKGLFRLCFYLSTSVLLVGGLVCWLLFSDWLYPVLEFHLIGREVIPLLFLNAFFWMVARYFYVLYRMEQDILLYTTVSILMNFFYRLFHLLCAIFTNEVFPLILCSAGGLGAFALFLCIWRRKILRPRRKDIDKEALRVIVPYGVAVAPTAVMIVLNSSFASVFVASRLGGEARGLYLYAIQLSNIVTTIQGGFASFWGAYMYANYRTQQPRIKKMHEYLNLIILVFFALLVAFEDVLFLILYNYAGVKPIFPLMMLGAVFTILCETTVYGITIAKKPIFDTLGIGLSFLSNVIFLFLLIEPLGLVGAALAVAIANFAMYLFRTVIAQKFYRTVQYPFKTTIALAMAVCLGAFGTVFYDRFWLKLAVCGLAILVYCLLYRQELVRCWNLGISVLKSLFVRKSS